MATSPLLCHALAALLCAAPVSALARPLTPAEWRADLDQLEGEMPRLHGNLYHAVSPKDLKAAFAALRLDLPRLREDQVVARLLALVALIQDGHNRVRGFCGSESGPVVAPTYYPLRLRRYDDEVFIASAAPEWARLAGGTITAIDGRPMAEVWRQVAPLLPHDAGNLGYATAHAGAYLTCAPLLHGLGVAARADGARFTIERADGQREDVVIAALKLPQRWPEEPTPPGFVDGRRQGAPVPLWQRHPDESFWFEPVPGQKLVYAQLRRVADGPRETLAATAARLGAYLAAHDGDRLALDLRDNSGGNNHLLKPLLVELIRARVNRRGHLYVLIGPATFSAAQNLVNRLEAYTEAIFVGAPTGENVNFYGDTEHLRLRHSGLTVALAHLYWQDADPRDRRAATSPEIAIALRAVDHRAGVDPALEWVARAAPPRSLDELLLAAAPRGAAQVLAAHRAYLADPLHRFTADAEERLNRLGYDLLARRRLAEALALAQANAELHPRSWNAWDSLGEVLEAAGQPVAALAAYQRSIALKPESPTGLAALRRLGGARATARP